MKKFVCTLAVILLAAAGLSAQEKAEKPWNIALKGGGDFSLYENAFTYRENGQFAKLIGYQAGLAFGYDFTKRFGIRLDATYGSNAGAGNVLETFGDGFYPYTFSSVNAFIDALLNLNPKGSHFFPKFYFGLGGAYSFNFSDMEHPTQELEGKPVSFGLRLGFLAEYRISPVFGIYIDLASEGYTDNYNKMRPSKEQKKEDERFKGYPGFPLDVRGLASLGVCFHF